MRVFVRACICAIARNEHFFTSLSKHTARFYCPELPCPAEAVVKGDSHVAAISAASIIAKVARDREMIELDAQHPVMVLPVTRGGLSQSRASRRIEAARRHPPHPSAQPRAGAAAFGFGLNTWLLDLLARRLCKISNIFVDGLYDLTAMTTPVEFLSDRYKCVFLVWYRCCLPLDRVQEQGQAMYLGT